MIKLISGEKKHVVLRVGRVHLYYKHFVPFGRNRSLEGLDSLCLHCKFYSTKDTFSNKLLNYLGFLSLATSVIITLKHGPLLRFWKQNSWLEVLRGSQFYYQIYFGSKKCLRQYNMCHLRILFSIKKGSEHQLKRHLKVVYCFMITFDDNKTSDI